MKYRIIAASAALAVVPVAGAVVAQPAQAAYNPPCASRAEYRAIHPGMTVARTQQIIGSKGRLSMGGTYMSQRQWHVCGSAFSWVTLTYLSGRLNNKVLI